MQFRAKIVTFAVVLACGAALCAMLTVILARGIDRGMQSVTRAEEQLALYLAMETTVSDLLRLHLTAAAAPTPEIITRLAETKSLVRDDIETIRSIAQTGSAPDNTANFDDLERLDQIEEVLNDIEGAFERISPSVVGAQPVDALAAPLTVVVDALDERLAPLVDIAVAGEAAEVIRARSEIAALSQRSVRMGTAAGVLTLIAAVVGVFALLKAFMRPFGALLEGASRLAQGDLSFRIDEGKRDEMGRLSRNFNVMAAQLETLGSGFARRRGRLAAPRRGPHRGTRRG